MQFDGVLCEMNSIQLQYNGAVAISNDAYLNLELEQISPFFVIIALETGTSMPESVLAL